jgi:hypothetical protein
MYQPMWHAGRIRNTLLLQVAFAGLGIMYLQPCIASPSPKRSPALSIPNSPSPKQSASPELLRQLPVTFEPNVGQAEAHVQFLSRTPSAIVSLGREGIFIGLPRKVANVQSMNDRTPPLSDVQTPGLRSETLAFRFSGASPRSEIEALDPLPARTNYYIGRDPSRWHTNVANYGRVRYHELYRGIDLVFHGEQGVMEYDFIVAPGADPKRIKLNVRGSRGMRLSSGSLIFKTPVGELRFAKPDVYQKKNGIRTNIRGRFVILAPSTIGFRVGPYDHSIPLIVDPVLTYATLLGDGTPGIAKVAVDSTGEIYLAGSSSLGVYVAKISSTGTSLVFSTFVGGTSIQTAVGLALDTNANAYVLGTTNSPDFATTPGSFRTVCPASIPGCSAPFVAKFGPTGTLDYSTLLSPGANARAIAVDNQGNTYITGGMDGPGLDAVNAFEPQYQGMLCSVCGNAFVQELNSSGTALVYSTYLAGAAGPNVAEKAIGVGIAVDSNGSAYVTGNAGPANFPTQNISPSLNSGRGIFLTKFKPDGSDLVYAASFSGSDTDTSAGIALDPMGDAYLTGSVSSPDFTLTPGAYSSSCVPVGSFLCFSIPQALAMEVSADGQSLIYSTLLGPESPSGIAVDSNGRAYIVGSTGQPGLPLGNPVQSILPENPGAPPNAFVMALDSSGFPFFSTFLGGAAGAIALDPVGQKIIVSGSGGGPSNNLPITDFPLVNPGIASCCAGQGYVATIDLAASGPMLSVSPRYDPYLIIRNVGSAPLNITSFASTDPAPLGGDCLPAHTIGREEDAS